jgi:HEAT repeat protein
LVRVAAVKGLAGTTDEEAVNKVLEIAGGDPDYDTRIAAVRSLQKANQRQVADSLLDWLVRATGRVGVAIVDTLAEIGDPRVISVLIEKGLAGKKMKRAAIAAAARLKTQDAISLLEILAADPNAKVAQTAQRYLPQDGSCGSEKQAESLLRSRNEVPNSNVEHPTRAE